MCKEVKKSKYDKREEWICVHSLSICIVCVTLVISMYKYRDTFRLGEILLLGVKVKVSQRFSVHSGFNEFNTGTEGIQGEVTPPHEVLPIKKYNS